MKIFYTLNIFILLFSTTDFAASRSTQNETRSLEYFSQITVGTGINLELLTGDRNEAVIEVENIELDDILTKISGDKLVIKINKLTIDLVKKNKIRVDIKLTYTDLENITANSGARIRSEETVTNEYINLKAVTGADVNLDISAVRVEATANTGAFMQLSGQCESLDVSVNTGGAIESDDLKATKVRAKASTGSTVTTWAIESIYAKANTGGSVEYKGDPEKVTKKKGTGGSISRI